MKDTVSLTTNESGDWEVLSLNGEVYAEGHDISTDTWIDLIHDLGHKGIIEEVTDEEMEQGLY